MEKVAIIVETREHKALPFVLNNVMSVLPDDWKLQIFHGSENIDYIKNIIKDTDYFDRTKLDNLHIDSITADESSLEIMLTEDFWERVIGETVLYFECDSMLCPN